MSKFDTIYTNLYEDVAGASTTPSVSSTPIQPTTGTAAVSKPPLQGVTDPKLIAASKALGIDPVALYKSLTGPDTTHTTSTQPAAQAAPAL